MFARLHAWPLAALGAVVSIGALSLGCGGPQRGQDEEPGGPGKADQAGSPAGQTADARLQALVDNWVEQTLQAHDVAALPARFSGAEVLAQLTQFANQVSFVEALSAGLNSFIKDGSDLESPRGLLEEFGPPTRDRSEQVREYLRQSDSKLRLVHRESVSGGVAEDHLIGWAPEGGESVTENWAFELNLPTLGDHSHWAIVKRTRDAEGRIQVYNYGFN